MLCSLQDVSERGILPIRHILPILTYPSLVPLAVHAAHAIFPVAPRILPPVIEHEHDRDKGTGADGGHDGNLGGDVLRRIARLESLGPNDIAEVESTRGEGGDDGPLRAAGDIRGHPAVHDGRHGDVELDQQDAREDAGPGADEGHEGPGQGGWDGCGADEEPALLDEAGPDAGEENCGDGDAARGDVEDGGLLWTVANVPEQRRGKAGADASIDNKLRAV